MSTDGRGTSGNNVVLMVLVLVIITVQLPNARLKINQWFHHSYIIRSILCRSKYEVSGYISSLAKRIVAVR